MEGQTLGEPCVWSRPVDVRPSAVRHFCALLRGTFIGPARPAAEITQIEVRLKAKWISIVQAELVYYNHVPYKLCGGLAAYCGHTLNEAKACVKASFEEFDSIADLSQAHYVALNLCGRESSASQQLFDFCQSPTTNLHDYPEAFQARQQYSFCSCAERAAEREHVMLRVATTRGLTYCKPASAWHRAGAARQAARRRNRRR